MVSAHDIAAELRQRTRSIGVVKLHKLLYYVQGWHLAVTSHPAFDERILAWSNGPVVADLWRDEKYDRPVAAQPQLLDGEAHATVDYVLSRYGNLTGKALIRMTHQEDPWRDAVENDDGWSESPEITHDSLRAWFQQDDEFRELAAEALHLQSRTDVHAFAPLAMTPARIEALQKTPVRERARHFG